MEYGNRSDVWKFPLNPPLSPISRGEGRVDGVQNRNLFSEFTTWDIGRKMEEKNEERYFIDSTNGFCIGLVFGLCHDASNMAGL